MKYKLLAIDLDGTLLKRHRKITKNNFKALKAFNDARGQIIISTGRAITSARRVANRIENYIGAKIPYIISLCGSVIYDDKNKIVSEKLINPEITKKIADEVKRLGLNIWIYPKEIEKEGVYSKSLALAVFAKTTKSINLKKIDFNKTSMFARKINVFGLNPNKIEKFETHLKNKLSKYVTIHKTNNVFMEISPVGGSKGDSIKIIADKLNIPLNEVAAIGDSGNDLSAAIVSKCFGAVGNNKLLKSYSSEEYSRLNSPVAKFINNRLLSEPTKVKLIGSDLDGTVLNGEKIIGSDFNKKIKPFINNNTLSLAFVSGRSVSEIHRIIKNNNLTSIPIRYAISNNGAIIYDLYKQKTIYTQPILKHTAYEIVNFFEEACKNKKYGDIACFFYTHNDKEVKKSINSSQKFLVKAYAFKENKNKFNNLSLFENFNVIYVDRLPKNLSIAKFLIFFKSTEHRDMFMNDLEKMNLNVTITTSSQTNIEINAGYVSKGNTLKRLAKMLKIKNSELMTLGDQTNDISMLKLTDWSFTFDYSPISVKNAAKYVIKQDGKENAIIKALKIYNKERNND